MKRRVLIAGCGFVGTRLAQELIENGDEVWALSRSARELPPGAQWLQADLTQPRTLQRRLPDKLTHLVFAASAGGSSDAQYDAVYVQGLRHVLEATDASHLQRLLFVSSTAVYHQNDGSWVDESSPTEPTHFSGLRTLQAEHIALSFSAPATVLRCAGIYGPGRTRLIDSVRSGQATFDPNCPRYTNRIHRDDVAGALAHLMDLPEAQPIYIGVDEAPVELGQVLSFLAERLAVPAVRTAPAATTGRGGNKRCRGDRLRQSGYAFRFPTFREGYGAMLLEMNHSDQKV